jgi:hypothetical protein
MRDFLIWSIEHDAWWRPAHAGYTRQIEEAGVYPEQEAARIVARANLVQVNECLIPTECLAVAKVIAEAMALALVRGAGGECNCRNCTHLASKHDESGSCRVCRQEGCWS